MSKKIKVKDLVQEGRTIHEKFNKKMNEAPFGNAPVGMTSPEVPHQYTDIKKLVKYYVQTRMDDDQGGSDITYDVEADLETLEQEIIKMKDKSYFELVSELASLYIYLDEFAGPSESKEVTKSIIRICNRLGLPSGDYT